MELIKGNSYIIQFNVNGVTLTYHCVITSIEDSFITFRDKFGKILTYNKNNIISVEVVR
jgi:hypothetical protein